MACVAAAFSVEPTADAQTSTSLSDINNLLQKAQSGDTTAQYELANRYDRAEGVPRDQNEAFVWYLKAAEGGHNQSQYVVGRVLANGSLGKRNIAEATKWITRAATNGHARAEFYLAGLYASGRGVPTNRDNSARLLRLAADHDSLPARALLGLITDEDVDNRTLDIIREAFGDDRIAGIDISKPGDTLIERFPESTPLSLIGRAMSRTGFLLMTVARIDSGCSALQEYLVSSAFDAVGSVSDKNTPVLDVRVNLERINRDVLPRSWWSMTDPSRGLPMNLRGVMHGDVIILKPEVLPLSIYYINGAETVMFNVLESVELRSGVDVETLALRHRGLLVETLLKLGFQARSAAVEPKALLQARIALLDRVAACMRDMERLADSVMRKLKR